MKRSFFSALLLILVCGCYDYGPKFEARPPAQAQITKELQATRPGATVFSGAPTNVPFETLTLENKIHPEWLKAPTEPFRLGPGDKIEVELVTDPATTRTVCTLGPDGKIYFYLLPGIDVWGLTLEEMRARIEEELKKYMRERPQVGVTLRSVESKRVWLMGRFQAPGIYPMPTPITLLEALSMAGGTVNFSGATAEASQIINSEELADLRRSFLVRKGQMLPVDLYRLMKEGDLSQNIYLEPDDFVYLSPMTAREIYVLGAVQSPRAVPFHDKISLIDVITSAGGPAYNAYPSHVAIVRGSLTQPKIAVVDYKSIVHGNATDFSLEPQDIVYVPLSPFRVLRRYYELIESTFVSSVAINEGTRAVSKQNVTTQTGVFIPFGSKITVSPSGGIAPVGPSQ